MCRTAKDNEYWAHISVNPGEPVQDADTRSSKTGKVVGARVDYQFPSQDVMPVDDHENITHIAVRIRTND